MQLASVMLTKEQLERYGTVQWLVNDGPIGSGRTFLLALAFIEKAIDCGCPIYIWNHNTHREAKRGLLREIDKIVSSLDGYNLEVIREHDMSSVQIAIHCVLTANDILNGGVHCLSNR